MVVTMRAAEIRPDNFARSGLSRPLKSSLSITFVMPEFIQSAYTRSAATTATKATSFTAANVSVRSAAFSHIADQARA